MSDDKSPEDGDEIVENIDDEIPIVDEDGETMEVGVEEVRLRCGETAHGSRKHHISLHFTDILLIFAL